MKHKIKSNFLKFLSIILLAISASFYSCNHNTIFHTQNFITDKITAEIPIGELFDKITILEIKIENINDPAKLANIKTELTALLETRNNQIFKHIDQKTLETLTLLTSELLLANKKLWETEDDIRNKERNKCFDKEFIQLARSIYIQNDERCRIKRAINELLGSRLIEEKSYEAY